jgi:tetratricopeptide (TPR) repeat protein
MASLANDEVGRDRLAQLPPPILAAVRRALLGQGLPDKGLNDPDPAVSVSCREALVGLWRMSDSAAGDGYLRQGLAAFEGGQVDAALAVFRKVEGLGGPVPPDLHRLLAEAYLAKDRPDDALDACRKALNADRSQFLALYAMARAYVAKEQYDQADKALTVALDVYREFPEAKALRAEVQSHLAPTP